MALPLNDHGRARRALDIGRRGESPGLLKRPNGTTGPAMTGHCGGVPAERADGKKGALSSANDSDGPPQMSLHSVPARHCVPTDESMNE